MVTRICDRSRTHIILLAIALSLAILFLVPAFGHAQEPHIPSVTEVTSTQPTAMATAAATATDAPIVETRTSGSGGASDADAVLVGAFTTTTVLALAGLALLDRKPEVE